MNRLAITMVVVLSAAVVATSARGAEEDGHLLVTYDNSEASGPSGMVRAPYRARKRYDVAPATRRLANAVAKEYALEEVERWPIRSLGIYCVVYRIPAGTSRDEIIDRLSRDVRVESAQPMLEFETGSRLPDAYNDTYAHLQRGLDLLQVPAAHRLSSGKGVRVAIVDGAVDADHEDLAGRLRAVRNFTAASQTPERRHGTAIASVIAANANNALGIVGIAPGATIDVYVACWAATGGASARCNSFTLAKAIDSLLEDPPDILNLSLAGPRDPLLARLLAKLEDQNVVIVAADNEGRETPFPASVPGVIGVRSAELPPDETDDGHVYAPGEQIMVAAPGNRYELSSGSSLSAAHVSGAIALLLSLHPHLAAAEVRQLLSASQKTVASGFTTIDSCRLLELADHASECGDAVARIESEHDLQAH